MFKKRLVFKIDCKEVINFSRILGKYGLKFKVSKTHCMTSNVDPDSKHFYREFEVETTKRQAYKLFDEINMANGRYFMK